MALFNSPSADVFYEVAMLLDLKRAEFEIPITQQEDDEKHFPLFLDSRLIKYANYYQHTLKGLIDDHPDSRKDENGIRTLHGRLLYLNKHLVRAVEQYYNGNITGASKTFGLAMKVVDFKANTTIATIPATARLYRAREDDGTRFLRKDLFHTPFEKRHLVSTSRYSIPGLPALYLGSSVYVCWEEFNRAPLRNLYFSQFRSYRDLRVVKIQRMEDVLTTLRDTTPDAINSNTTLLLRYLLLLPLSIACSIRTRESKGSFKPEYIIPQLLLQYITTNKDVDGIMFPSTKVEYDNIQGVPAYNYVFPVKQSHARGFCEQLSADFVLTQPTSVDIESMLNYSGTPLPIDRFHPVRGDISLVEGVLTYYRNTVFGQLEEILHTRLSAPVYER